MTSSTSSVSSPSNSVSKSSEDISDIQEAQEQKAARRVRCRNITLLAVTIIAIAAAAVAIFALHAISLHLWMIYPLIGLAYFFGANNIGYFLQKTPNPIAVLTDHHRPSISEEESEPAKLPGNGGALVLLSEEEEQEKATLLMQEINEHIKLPRTLNHTRMNERVKPYLGDRNAEGVTVQFRKDSHRTGKIILANQSGAIVYPGANDATDEHVKTSMLAQLKAFASLDGDLNLHLFTLLQESLCQNFHKEGAEQELFLYFGEKYGSAAISIIWNKTCVKLEQTGPTTFTASQEYDFLLKSPWDGSQIKHKVRVEQLLDSEQIIQATRRCVLDEEPTLIELGNPSPCPVLKAPRVFLGGSVPAPALTDEQIRDRS